MQDEDFNNSERDNPYEINDGRDEEQIPPRTTRTRGFKL